MNSKHPNPVNKIQPVSTSQDSLELLQWKYLNVLELWILGFSYEVIAQKTGFTHQYIRLLFSRKGKLRAVAEHFKATAHKESIDETMNVLYGGLADVARTMIQSGKLPFEVAGVMAGKTVFEYTLGKPAEKGLIEAKTDNQRQVSPEVSDQVLAAIDAFKKQYYESDPPALKYIDAETVPATKDNKPVPTPNVEPSPKPKTEPVGPDGPGTTRTTPTGATVQIRSGLNK
jgi:hypothetical protein